MILLLCNINGFAENKYALLIGISEYPIHSRDTELSWKSIHGGNDIDLLNKTLKQQGFKVESLKDKQATAKNVRQTLKNVESKINKGGIVYFHFSGHGQAFEDLSGDEEDGWDEAIVPYDAYIKYSDSYYKGDNHILDDELEGYFNDIRNKIGSEGFLYVVLDACHMGGASRGEESEEDEVFIRGTDNGFSLTGKKFIPKIDRRGNMMVVPLKNSGNICILEACRAYQTNSEISNNGQYYGPLSYYINKCLQTTTLSSNTDCIETVRSLMQKDKRLIKQNMVVEKSF